MARSHSRLERCRPALLAAGEEHIDLNHGVALFDEQVGGVVHGVNKVALVGGAALLSSDNPTPGLVLHQANDELLVFVHATMEEYRG